MTVQIPGRPIGINSTDTFFGVPVVYVDIPGEVQLTVPIGYAIASGHAGE